MIGDVPSCRRRAIDVIEAMHGRALRAAEMTIVRYLVASLVEKLKESGARLRGEIVSGPGGKQILVNDPSGNPVELFESSGV